MVDTEKGRGAGSSGLVEAGAGSRAAVALGSNLGDRVAHLRAGLQGLDGLLASVLRSSVYETAAVGPAARPPFLNLCVVGRTSLPPRALLDHLQRIEAARGRVRTGVPDEPRTLDLDLLLYGDVRIEEPGLVVPHPRMTERAFVLVPLAEVAPAWEVPGTGRSVGELAEEAGRLGVEARPGLLGRVAAPASGGA